MRVTRPLFLFDPGWLFVLVGLIVCAAGVLLPAQADLHALEQQLAQLQSEEARAYQRLAAHADFIDQVENGDESIIKRLAAAQLNVVPDGDKPLLLSSTDASPVTEWIDATVELDIRPPQPELASMLSRWASGPSRLWMFGGGIMAVFIGLLITPGTVRKAREVGVAEAMIQTAAQQWRSGAFGRVMVGEPLQSSTSAACEPMAWESIEDDASQLADTVDLEERDLMPLSRNVIDDDDHNDSEPYDDDASDVMIEAKELTSPAPVAGAEIVQDAEATDDAGVANADEVVAFIDEGIGGDEAAMLLADQLTAGTGLLEQVEWNPAFSTEGAGAEADAEGAATPEIVVEPPVSMQNAPARRERSRRRNASRARKASPLTQPLEPSTDEVAADTAAATTAETADDGAAIDPIEAASHESIPFLRYRRNADDDGDRHAPGEADAACDDDTDEQGPMKFRRR